MVLTKPGYKIILLTNTTLYGFDSLLNCWISKMDSGRDDVYSVALLQGCKLQGHSTFFIYLLFSREEVLSLFR